MRQAALTLLFLASRCLADLFVSGFGSGGVYRFDENSGAPIGSGVFIAPSAPLQLPHDVMRLADGTFIVASAGNDQVLHYSATGAFLSAFIVNGANGVPANTLDYPVDFTLGPDGLLYVTSQLNDRIVRFDATTGAFAGVFASLTNGFGPSGLAFHPNGDLYVVGRFGGAVLRLDGDTGATVGGFSATGLGTPYGIAVNPADSVLYVAVGSAATVRRIDPATGSILGSVGSSMAAGGSISGPIGVRFGPGGDLFVASLNNDKIARYDGLTGVSEGDFAVSGTTGLDAPNFFTFAVPEPGSALLFAFAVCCLCGRRRA
jgi:DNA-binding beta-propeller fold protein YncE